jgi:hypothetical protein
LDRNRIVWPQDRAEHGYRINDGQLQAGPFVRMERRHSSLGYVSPAEYERTKELNPVSPFRGQLQDHQTRVVDVSYAARLVFDCRPEQCKPGAARNRAGVLIDVQ